jgi:glutamate formiminotransferase/formiminotetrahydrofolate cyclodeaminase
MKLVECVPNFSEGRDRSVIDAISAAVSSVSGVSLLDVDPGEATNRTVFTFVGSPDNVLEAAFQAIKTGSCLIDMSRQKGEHPRMGACDVCPFIPVANVSVAECVELSNRLGARVAEELGIPVYLYEYAAKKPERKSLAWIREGEYEGLKEQIIKPERRPDFGEALFNAKSGATVIGCREFLIAYNINLNTKSKKLANDIALCIREKGKAKRDEKGKFVYDENGEKLMEPGLFKECRAIGWYLEDYGIAQISINLTNYKVTPLHEVFDAVEKLAFEKGLRVTGSEVVGLIPKEAMVAAGQHYLKKQGRNTGVNEGEIIDIAIRSLGLSEFTVFDPLEKIIEYKIQQKNRLVDLTVHGFIDECASDSMAPGGGSVAALAGSLGAALTAMVATLSFDKKGYKKKQPLMESLSQKAQTLKKFFTDSIDADTDAFNAIISAMRLPKDSPEEQNIREQAIDAANKGACEVPMSVLGYVPELLTLVREAVQEGNPNSVTDVAVAGLMGEAAACGAAYNVLINLAGINDQDYVGVTRARVQEIQAECVRMNREIQQLVAEKMSCQDAG